MNKTDRMLAIVLLLQARGILRAEDLAAEFETSVRTIYRDMQALSEAGVLIIGAPGTGYSLMEGYFLPPVSFSVNEAVALLIGADFMVRYFDDFYRNTAESSRIKIEALLPDPIRQEAERVRSTIRLLPDMGRESATDRERQSLSKLRLAVLHGHKIHFHYTRLAAGADGQRSSERTASPYGLVLVRGNWMLVAFCELRQEIRHFRVSRMSQLAMLEESATRPPDFDLEAYTPPDNRNLLVRIEADAKIADRIQESGGLYLDDVTEQGGRLLITLRIRQPEEVVGWILSYGGELKVLEPESLRMRIREEAQKMIDYY